jgi:predicted O-methyltransferase YrrM
MFNKLVWYQDRMLLDDLVFRIEQNRDENWELGENCFVFYKRKGLVDQYKRFCVSNDFHPQHVFELGIWDGGSTAFWFEYFHPEKYVAIDIKKKEDSKYFRHYVKSRNLEERIKTYWGIDQADSERLRQIFKNEFSAPLDLVIDDASHLYKPTKTSFETLFPLLRPGGLYIIEDWAWAHWKEFQLSNHPWARETELTKLIFELIEATGSLTTLIANLTIFQGFVVVERGEIGLAEHEFNLDKYISRRPKIPSSQ